MARYLPLLVATFLLGFVAAIPYGVVDCGGGKESVVQNFNIAAFKQVGGGPLSDYNVTITIDDEVLDPNTPFDFEVLRDHLLILTARGKPFSGFLIRMDGIDEGSTVDAILPVETPNPPGNSTSYTGAKEVFICKEAYFVAGVSHDSPERKFSMELILNMNSVMSNLILDVSVIAETSVGQNFSEWYFSAFTLNAVEDEIDTHPATVSPTVRLTEPPTPDESGRATQSGVMIVSPFYFLSLALGVGLLVGQ